jgi:uncharacterized RDD family membrane protein YckC
VEIAEMSELANEVRPMESHEAVKYAGFWLRFCAAALDVLFFSLILLGYSLVCTILGYMIHFLLSLSLSESVANGMTGFLFALAAIGFFIICIAYEPYFLSSKYQATPGMMVLNLKIVDIHMKRISFGRALARWLCQYISSMILYIGFIMIAFTEKKQGLHDMMTDTLVIRV